MSLIAQRVIQQAYNLPVERVMADIGIQYASVARGDLDLMLMAWLPLTHKDYWTRVRDRVLDFGSMYSGRLGWVVPDYVDASELRSIADLRKPELAARFDNTVQGIDPGSGLNQASERALVDYNLSDMRLVASSSAAMTLFLIKRFESDVGWWSQVGLRTGCLLATSSASWKIPSSFLVEWSGFML